MATIRDIRKKISAIKGIYKITKSMKLIAQIRYQSTQRKLLPLRPYSFRVKELLSTIISILPEKDIGKIAYFNDTKTARSILVLVLSSDRGLCGNFNSMLFKEVEAFIKKNRSAQFRFIAVGQKGYAYLKRRNQSIYSQYLFLPSIPPLDIATQISNDCVRAFTGGEADEVWIAFNEFESISKFRPHVTKFIPMVPEPLPIGTEIPQYIVEPDTQEILNTLLPQYLKTAVFEMMFESALSEYSARVIAMDSATSSAEKMISDLMLVYHKARQSRITTELIEVVSGAEALK